jgi:hypothetical protein
MAEVSETQGGSVWSIDAAKYVPHALHREERAWNESNCYVDLWIELIHAQSFDPLACLPFTIASDFEGDQWTFFKPPLGDLLRLYGLEVQELNIWRSLVMHIAEQVAQKRPVIVEVDSFFLPDTAGMSYQIEHVKTSIGVEQIDIEKRTLGYFHNAGYFTLAEADFRGIFRLDVAHDPSYLPPYVELVKFHRVKRLSEDELVRASLDLAREHLAARPKANPVTRYKARFGRDLEWLKGEDLAEFHRYAFATLRQCGACYELLAHYLRWLEKHGEKELEPIALEFEAISNGAKALQFKTARAVNTKKNVDFAPLMSSMEASWDSAIGRLVSRFG